MKPRRNNRDLQILRRVRLDEYNNEYEIFSILSRARVNQRHSVILAGKRGSRRHSTTSFSENVEVAGTSYQMLNVLSFCDRERV